MTRLVLLPLAALAIGCAPAVTPARSHSGDACSPPARRGSRPDSTIFPSLAGVWEIRYTTESSHPPGWTWTERIVLWDTDERHSREEYLFLGRRWRPISWRPLVGVRTDTAAVQPVVDSLRVDDAEVELVGGLLVVYDGRKNMLDGSSHALVLGEVSTDAFRGTWTSDLGIAVIIDSATGERLPNPSGWFCARRIGPPPPRPHEVHYHDEGSPAVPDSGNGAPKYPEILRSARVSGTVHLRATIDSVGRVDPRSLLVVASTHDLFTNAARRAIGEWRFRPATREGRSVPRRLDLLFDFMIGREDSIPLRPIHRLVRSDTALRVVLGWEPVPRQASVSLGAAELRAAQLAAVRAVGVPADSGRATCIFLRRGNDTVDPTPMELEALSSPAVAAIAGSGCPPTYASMTQRVDATGRPVEVRPPGAFDPWHVTITRVEPWTDDIVVVDINTGLGSSGHRDRCETRRSEGVWRARCERRGSWVS